MSGLTVYRKSFFINSLAKVWKDKPEQVQQLLFWKGKNITQGYYICVPVNMGGELQIFCIRSAEKSEQKNRQNRK